MFRDRVLGMTIIALLLTSLACNAFAGSLEPFPPPPTPIAEGDPGVSAVELVATATVPALSPLSSARVTVLVDLNVRSGPGVQYDRVGFLLKNDTVPVVGIHALTGWWRIDCPDVSAESECWVSGGQQYTKPADVEGVAEIEAPSTPTPVPPKLEEGHGILAFIDDGLLHAMKLDLTQNSPQPASEAMQLADVMNVQSFAISPDGRRIAFLSASSKANSLYVVNTDGQDLRILLNSTDLPLEANPENIDFALLVDQITWLPDNTAVAFNTVAINQLGAGISSQEDLWSVTLDGELSSLFPTGFGGGVFAFTSSNKVILSRSDNIARADLDGSNNEVVLEFEPVNTASEYVFYPKTQLAGQGQTYTYIPDAEPWQPGAWTTLWRIPGTGPSGQLGSIEDAALLVPILWSPDGSRLAFIQQPADLDPQAVSMVVIADGKGINASPYAGGNQLAVHAWGSDSEKFIYSGDGFYAVGRVNAPPVQILLNPGQQVADAQWITGDTIVAGVGSSADNSWELISSSLSGENISLTNLRGYQPIYDIWHP